MKLKLFLLALFIVLLCYPSLAQAAVAYQDITLDANHSHGSPQLNQVTLGNGKFLYAYGEDHSDSVLHVYVFSASGVQQAHSTITIVGDYRIKSLSVLAINDDVVIISYFLHYDLANRVKWGCVEYDTSTYTWTERNHGSFLGHSGVIEAKSSQMFEYGNEVYGMHTYYYSGGTHTIYFAYNYDGNNLYDDHVAGGSCYGYTFGFPDSDAVEGLEYVYLISSTRVDNDRPRYLKWDLSDWNNTGPELLATSPLDAVWDWDNELSLRYFGGDIYYNETEADYYLYHTWGIGDPGSPSNSVYLRQSNCRFNSSGIDLTFLEAQILTSDSADPLTGYPSQETSICTGWLISSSEIYMIIENRYDDPSDYRGYMLQGLISDWGDFGLTAMDLGPYDDGWTEAIEVQGHQYIMYKEPNSQFESSRQGLTTRIYYGLEAHLTDWDVTLTYLPADDPPETFTNYQFTGTIFSGSQRVETDYEVYLDDVIIEAGRSNTQGEFYFPIMSSIAGYRIIEIRVYYADVLAYTEEFPYVFASADEGPGTTPGYWSVGIQALFSFLPVFIMVLFPPLVFYFATENLIVFFVVLIICCFTGSITGIIPNYVLFLVALLSCLFFYLSFRESL